MGLNWLITGGCGFIGTSLIKTLVAEGGHSVRVLDNLSVGTRADLESVCAFIEIGEGRNKAVDYTTDVCQLVVGDILASDRVAFAAQGADVIVHLAANTGVAPSVEDPRMDCMANVIGTLNCLEAARSQGVRRFVFASSGAPIGEVTPPIHEEMVPHPVSPYGASKLAGEAYCSAYFRTFGIETVALRFGNVYGPGSGHKNSVVAKFIRQAVAGEILEIYGDGTQTRDFVYIDDLIGAIVAAATRKQVGGEVFQIATSYETNLNELAHMLSEVLRSTDVVKEVVIRHGAVRLGDVLRNYSDTSKARKVLGWEPTTTLKNGLEETVRWFFAVMDRP